MPTQTRPPINSALILDAALRLIEQSGLEGLSMRKLGEEFEIQAASLYWYFESKDALLERLADELYGRATTHIEQRNYGTLNPDEYLRAVLSTYREFLIQHAHLAELLGRSRPVGPGYVTLVLALAAPVRQLLLSNAEKTGQIISLLLDYVHGAVRAQQAPFDGGRSLVEAIIELNSHHVSTIALPETLHSNCANRFQLGLASLILGLQQAVSD